MQYIPMKKIRNLKELHSEKLRLKLELISAEQNLKEDLEWIKEEMKPGKIAGRIFNSFIGQNKEGFLNNGLRITTDVLLNNLILAKSGWIKRLIVPFIVKSLSSNYFSENKPEIFGILRNIIQKARKSIKHDDVHFDASTVDEKNY